MHYTQPRGTAYCTPKLYLTNCKRKTVHELDRSKKSFNKNHDKNFQEVRKKENFLNLIMSIYKKPTANITIEKEKVNTFPQQLIIRQVMSPLNIAN